MKEPRFKEGDKIKFLPPSTHICKYIGKHKFAGEWQYAEIGAVFIEEDHNEYMHYGVYAEYGQDYVEWEDAHKI
jgi:hypothetical protein